MAEGPKRGFFSRSRGLEDFNRKFSKNIVEKTIKRALKPQKEVRVLEIGCGEGKVLMELRKQFPNIELHGINKKPWQAMKGSVSLKRTATLYKIFTQSEVKKIKLPKIHFYDASKLKFKDDYFDIVISQVAIQYVKRKDELLEEVWRVLKKGGKAFLNLDTVSENFPDYLRHDSPRFIIYKNGRVYPLKRYIQDLKKSGYDISYRTYSEIDNKEKKKRINVIMNKNKKSKLKLKLIFDELSSLNMGKLKKIINNSLPIGYRSVYRIK